jgi:hypothetical protein
MSVIKSKSFAFLFVFLTLFQMAFFFTLAHDRYEFVSWLPEFLQFILGGIYLFFYFVPLAIIVGTFFERDPQDLLFWGVFYLLPLILIYSLVLSFTICWIKSKFISKRH